MFFLRKLLFLVFSVQLLSFATPVSAATEATPLAFNNKITGNVRWTKQNSPYLIRQTLSIPQGSSLTIDPGVVVKFDENTGSIFSQGAIHVGGVLSEKVIFTSILDDTRGGVTRLSSQTEVPKEAGSIKGGISLWSGQGAITNADFFYFSPFIANKAIAIQSGTHALSSLSFRYGKTAIVQAGGSTTVTDSTFDNSHYGIEATGGHTTFRNNTFHNKGINLRGNVLFTDEGNNQGAGTIFLEGSNTEVPFVLQTNLKGDQMPYRAHRLSVPLGADVSFGKGLTLMMNHSLSVQGRLTLEGTAEDPLTITSSQDEQGVDRNKDGLVTSGTQGQWSGVSVSGGTLNGTYAHLKYGGSGGTGLIETFSATAQVSLANSILSDSSLYLIRGFSGNIHVTDSILTRSPMGVTSSAGGTTAIEIHKSSFLRPLPSAVINQGTGTEVKTIDATNNFWDNVNGPELNTASPQDPQKLKVSQRVNYAPFLTRSPICEQNCRSSVAFLPGIMGSRLYEDGEEIWFSTSDQKQERLSMNPDGTSKYDVYTIPQTHFVPNLLGLNQKQPGIINDPLRFNLYHSFLRDIAEWHQEGLFFDYAFLPYDWRLSLEDIVMNGKVQDGKLSYTEENTDLSQSYLYQQIKKLEEESYTGKVTLIGHSNGGLIIKAFIQKLKEHNDPLYHKIDQVILVAVPQTGTPDATVSMLYGSGLGAGFIVSAERARDLARNMPGMYSLLPSEALFPEVSPQISFQGVPSIWTEEYGNTINTHEEFQNFLQGKEGRREADYEETNSPQVLRESLLTQVKETHRALDNWQPSQNTKVTTLAGTGLFTAKSIETQKYMSCLPWRDGGIVKCKDPKEGYTQTIKLTLDGDETVLEQSALHGVGEEWWVDLWEHNKFLQFNFSIREHKDILEVDTLHPFIKCLLQKATCDTQNNYIQNTKPTYQNRKYTKYEVHSPVRLTVTDSQGNITGYNTAANETEVAIPDSQYFEIGEVKIALIPKTEEHTVGLSAYQDGSFSFIKQELENEEVLSSTTLSLVPVFQGTQAEVLPSENLIIEIDFEMMEP
jgi:pimeloyl-ACP methyl ester carboxylesterase